jgi:uncharacterized protein (DUF486 family)
MWAMKSLLVPLMLATSGSFMAVAWLGHLRIRQYGFWIALLFSWAIVLPEYLLNVGATRWGYGTYSGAQMASIHLCSGVVFAALVSHFVLGEALSSRQLLGFGLVAGGIVLVLTR